MKLGSRDDLLQVIAKAAVFGNLGLFVGSGFNLDLCDDAPTFRGLIESLAEDLDLELDLDDPEVTRGRSYPQLASLLVEKLRGKGLTRKRAVAALKASAAALCDLSPSSERVETVRALLKACRLAWIITTNYDFVLESLLEDSDPLLPNQVFSPRRGLVPIYHLHGHRHSPRSIVITEEDYVELLGPVEYRQLKLATLLLESTTVMLGYSRGDINVRSAREWAHAFRRDKTAKRLRLDKRHGLVIQALYVPKSPKSDPYLGPDKEVIVEIESVQAFLEELTSVVKEVRDEHRAVVDAFKEWIDDPTKAEDFAKDGDVREEFVAHVIAMTELGGRTSLSRQFLDDALTRVWTRARRDGGFRFYGPFLESVLDLLEQLPLDDLHPSIFAVLASRLSDVADYIDPKGRKISGTGFAASALWRKRRDTLPDELLERLKSYAQRREDSTLMNLLK